MAENSKIEWTNHTGNIWWGCDEVHSGCDNCYARVYAHRFHPGHWGDTARLPTKSFWKDLARYQKNASENKVEMTRVFIGSMMDIFEKSKRTTDGRGTGALRDQFFSQISQGLYPDLMLLLLTKRASNINKLTPDGWKVDPPGNVLFGATAVDAPTMRDVSRHFSKVNGRTFLSIEPQLGFIDLIKDGGGFKPDWIIQGGESGPQKRPFDLAWARHMRDQCADLAIPYFFKQIDKVQTIPEDLMVRQFPIFFYREALLDPYRTMKARSPA